MNPKIEEYMKLPLEKIEGMIEENERVLDKIWAEDDGSSYENYKNKCKPYHDELYCLTTAKTMILPREEIETRPMDELDKECKIPIAEYTEMCKTGYVSNYDGHGVYATETETASWLYANPRAFYEGYIRKDFDYVCWYNK